MLVIVINVKNDNHIQITVIITELTNKIISQIT